MSDITINTENEPLAPEPKRYAVVLSTLSAILAILGLIITTLGLLGLLPIFDYGSVLFFAALMTPHLTWGLEILAIVIGIIALVKLPKKTRARKISTAGVFIGSLVLVIFAAVGICFLFLVNSASL